MMVHQLALLLQMVPGSILSFDHCLCGVSHALPEWVRHVSSISQNHADRFYYDKKPLGVKEGVNVYAWYHAIKWNPNHSVFSPCAQYFWDMSRISHNSDQDKVVLKINVNH